jgi:probable HAF family extracellular repeat protein
MNLRYVKSLAIAALVALGILPVLARAQLIDLGVATGYAINNAGQVVLSTGIYSNGTVTPLPALPGQTTPITAVAINASGQVVGSAGLSVVDPAGSSAVPPGGSTSNTVAVEFSNGTLTDLFAPLTPGFTVTGTATGINSSGEIVGYATVNNPKDEDEPASGGFIYINGASQPFPTYGGCGIGLGNQTANAINDSGQVVGSCSPFGEATSSTGPAGYYSYAYILDYAEDTWTYIGQGTANAINGSGEVTGTLAVGAHYLTYGGSTTAFLFSNGTLSNLGALPGANGSVGSAINSRGQIVGSSGSHAFFYNGTMNDLNMLISATDPLKPYVTLTSAVGINDNLLIVANGVDSRTGKTHAYLYQASFVHLAPAALDFAMLAVGSTSEAQSVTLTNSGTTALPIGTAYVTGNFSLRADNCGTSLAPSGQCRISVVFLPKVVGVLSGALSIPVDGANYQVPLSGVAPITAKITASSGTATVGQPVTLAWTVSPGSTCVAASSSTNTAWTASKPPFAGNEAANGKQTLTESLNGTVDYILACKAPGVAEVDVSASVVWTWPPVTISIAASPTTITAGQSTTITWTASNATSCAATSGGPADSWAGTKATSGNQTVTEAFALETASVALTFGITCNSTTSGLSSKASVNVTENQAPASSSAPTPPTSSGGGGGALNPLSLAFLAGILAWRRARLYRRDDGDLRLHGRIMKPGYVIPLAIAAFSAWWIMPVFAQSQLIDLGVATGYAINNSGQAALSTGIYSKGIVTALPVLPRSTAPATPLAINVTGQVAGTAPLDTAMVPVEYSAGTLTNLLPPEAAEAKKH